MIFIYELYFLFNNESSCTDLSFLEKHETFSNMVAYKAALVQITFYIFSI